MRNFQPRWGGKLSSGRSCAPVCVFATTTTAASVLEHLFVAATQISNGSSRVAHDHSRTGAIAIKSATREETIKTTKWRQKGKKIRQGRSAPDHSTDKCNQGTRKETQEQNR